MDSYTVSAETGRNEWYGRWRLDSARAIKGRDPAVMPECITQKYSR